MENTVKRMTEEERRQHQHFIIQQWKKDVEEARADLEARLKTQEFKEMLKRLKDANAKRGINIPGEI